MDQRINHFFRCLLFVIPQKRHFWFSDRFDSSRLSTDYTMWLFLHGCSASPLTNQLGKFCSLLGQFVGYFASFLKPSLALLSSPWLAIFHGIVQSTVSHPSPRHWPALFRDLLRYLFAPAPVQPYLKNIISTPVIVCWQQTEMSFPFL